MSHYRQPPDYYSAVADASIARLLRAELEMDANGKLAAVRRAYAKQIAFYADVDDPRIIAAFATVPREAFLDPGPWSVVRLRPLRRGYAQTPDDDPVYVYSDDVIALVPERSLNNGQPSLHAALIAGAAPQIGEHVVHIGIGFGYYTAIFSELVAPPGGQLRSN